MRELLQQAFEALITAEAGLADIGDAERKPGDDLAWCEARAATALALPRRVIKALGEALAQPAQPAAPDMPAICAELGFDPTNHHNAARCPYCTPAKAVQPAQPTTQEAFEAWASSKGLSPRELKKSKWHPDEYSYTEQNLRWEGWQAATAHTREACAKLCEMWQPMETLGVFVGVVLMWNETANTKHSEKSYRIGHPLLENTSDCTHWMPLPQPPTAAIRARSNDE